MRWTIAMPLFVYLVGASAIAGTADVVDAAADCAGSVCRFTASVRHDDEGWGHYANAWEVVAPDGSVIATRVLAHPHVGEQPFTRSLGGVEVPPGVARVRIRARDSVHGLGGREAEVVLGRQPEATP